MTLKEARETARLTQRALAEAANVDHSLISHVEAGRRSLETAGYATVIRLAAALGVDASELVPVALLQQGAGQ